MTRIHVVRSRPQLVEAEKGAILMDELLEAGIPVASSCQGDGVCGKCKLTVKLVDTGKLDLNELTADEIRHRSLGNLNEFQRLACQYKLKSDILVEAPYW